MQFLSKVAASKGRSDIAPHKQLINGRTLLFYQGTLQQRQFIKANGRFMKANCRFIKAGPDGRFAKGSPMATLSRAASNGRFIKADGRFSRPVLSTMAVLLRPRTTPQWPFIKKKPPIV